MSNAHSPVCQRFPYLRDQVALVTGASSGIGKAVAIAMAGARAHCVLTYHSDQEGAQDAIRTIKSTPDAGDAEMLECDVSQEQDVLKLFDFVRTRFGRVDIVVANAGIQKDAALVEMSLEEWQAVLAVNLTGQFLCMREAVRQFNSQERRPEVSAAAGKIICISSVHEVIPWAGRVNYAASKGGLNLLMRSVAQEVAQSRIRVNSIAPGAIRTAINQDEWDDPKSRQELLKLIPYGRIGDPEDVARLAVWLSSDEADYITGETIVIDGGMTLYPAFRDGG